LNQMQVVESENNALFLNLKIPSKKSRFCKWSCDDDWCNAMQDYEIIGHDKNLAKRATWFGALVWKLCTFEV
jgi:hypothetical protein